MEHQLANGQFLLTVSGTEHGEWQGSLHTADGRDVSFRSVMELILDMNRELGLALSGDPFSSGHGTDGT